MKWQKCPVCDGSGLEYLLNGIAHTTCSVCKGTKIINELTGKPPHVEKAKFQISEVNKLSDLIRKGD
jgi:DnaJ-class molecular chaperone